MDPLPGPMLPVAGRLPTGDDWSHEFKWDGLRVAAGVGDGRLRRLQSRLGNDLAGQFPELHTVGEHLDQAILDGELVILTNDLPDWGAVIRRRQARRAAVAALAAEHPATVMLFDVLALNGEDLRTRPYVERREVLEGLNLADGWAVPPVSSDGPAMLAVSLDYGLEGVVSKRNRSKYASGKRSRDWVKTRHKTAVDAVVVGWVRRDSGGVTLLLAEASGQRLLSYLGRCTAPRSIVEVLAPLAATAPPVAVPDATRAVQWVRPELQVEVTASARTPDGRLRQAQLVRVRLDRLP